jgi:hypothetical protein
MNRPRFIDTARAAIVRDPRWRHPARGCRCLGSRRRACRLRRRRPTRRARPQSRPLAYRRRPRAHAPRRVTNRRRRRAVATGRGLAASVSPAQSRCCELVSRSTAADPMEFRSSESERITRHRRASVGPNSKSAILWRRAGDSNPQGPHGPVNFKCRLGVVTTGRHRSPLSFRRAPGTASGAPILPIIPTIADGSGKARTKHRPPLAEQARPAMPRARRHRFPLE